MNSARKGGEERAGGVCVVGGGVGGRGRGGALTGTLQGRDEGLAISTDYTFKKASLSLDGAQTGFPERL